MIDLDAVIARARAATVDRAAAERYVRELDLRERAPRRSWWPAAWLAAGIGFATAGLLMLWLWPDAPPASVPVPVSHRVTIIADPDTGYRVVHASTDETLITITSGAVTARLWPEPRSHRMVLSGGGITAIATGTVYSLAIRPTGAVVSVMQGTVEVHAGDAIHIVHAHHTWPSDATGANPAAGYALLALASPPSPLVPPASEATPDASVEPPVADAEPLDQPATEPMDATVDASDAPVKHPTRIPPAPPVVTLNERWRKARLLRSQGHLDAAVTECLAIADARDATWSPIALIEGARIELGPLADPAQAIAIAERVLRDWPDDVLASEARALRCRALGQLGRGDECAATSQ